MQSPGTSAVGENWNHRRGIWQKLEFRGEITTFSGDTQSGGNRRGEGGEIPGFSLTPILQALASASHWLMPTRSHLASAPGSLHRTALWNTERNGGREGLGQTAKRPLTN